MLLPISAAPTTSTVQAALTASAHLAVALKLVLIAPAPPPLPVIETVRLCPGLIAPRRHATFDPEPAPPSVAEAKVEPETVGICNIVSGATASPLFVTVIS